MQTTTSKQQGCTHADKHQSIRSPPSQVHYIWKWYHSGSKDRGHYLGLQRICTSLNYRLIVRAITSQVSVSTLKGQKKWLSFFPGFLVYLKRENIAYPHAISSNINQNESPHVSRSCAGKG